MGHIKAYYEGITPVDESDWQYIVRLFEWVSFAKGDILTAQGSIEQFLYFIETGIVRYFICQDTIERTFDFGFEKTFAGAYDSMVLRTPCGYQLGALTDVTAWRISYDNLQQMYQHTKIGNAVGRKLSETLYVAKSKRELALLNLTAKERYLSLFSERPEIIRRIPQKYVASYIGITPQALSRIRREIC